MRVGDGSKTSCVGLDDLVAIPWLLHNIILNMFVEHAEEVPSLFDGILMIVCTVALQVFHRLYGRKSAVEHSVSRRNK